MDYLRGLSAVPDSAIDLAEAGLALAALELPEQPLAPYREHLSELGSGLADRSRRLGREDGLEARIAILNELLFGRYGYRGDSVNYDDLQNANLMRVIDRRRGIPVSLGILYIHVARARGWSIVGLNFPGHFMVRLEHDGKRAIIDPFNEGTVRAVAELREMLKTSHGDEAELGPDHYAPVGNREILLRLQNNLKLRLVQSGDFGRALAVVESMLLFAPDEAPLWHDAGALQAKLGNLRAAIQSLEVFMTRTDQDAARRQVAALLQQIRSALN
jgi:regulator of sirC expression with transglutaminase-like and TPR domain